jgi:hypothetical protein
VVKKTWWTLALDQVLIGDVDIGLCDSKSEGEECKIIMDSGSSLLATPPKMLSPFLKEISKYSHCGEINKYPIITFVINGVKYPIDPYEYVLTEQNR